MKKSLLLFFGLSSIIVQSALSQQVKAGTWRATLLRDGHSLPFGLDISPKAGGKYTVFALNGSERLPLDDAYFQNDSLHIPMLIFDSDLVVKVTENKMSGVWKKLINGVWANRLPFTAEFGSVYLFTKNPQPASFDVSGKWQTYFYKDNGDSTKAVGIFEQKGSKLSGTFLTATGDYRYLAGDVIKDSLFLSCFDGSHVYMFRAKISNNVIRGGLWAGASGFQKFGCYKDANASLPDPYKLTYLKDGYETIDFSFPTPDGKMVSLKDERYKNKVVILQISGTWCPNCMDETRFMVPWYKKNNSRGVEVINLSFERSLDMKISGPKIEFMKKRFGVPYSVVLAGLNDATAGKSLPMLNKVAGYPTTIFIDKKGKVRQIHTGFSGPGTGKYYEEFIEEFNLLINKLLAE